MVSPRDAKASVINWSACMEPEVSTISSRGTARPAPRSKRSDAMARKGS